MSNFCLNSVYCGTFIVRAESIVEKKRLICTDRVLSEDKEPTIPGSNLCYHNDTATLKKHNFESHFQARLLCTH